MYKRKRHPRAWAAIPAIVLIVAISLIAAPTASAAYTTQVAIGVVLMPISALDVGTTAAHVPVAVVTVPRLPATSTSSDLEPLKPVNFVQGFALGFALVLIGWLLLLGVRKSA